MPDIIVNKNDRFVEKLSLEKEVITIGRGEQNDVTLEGHAISRLHAMIFSSPAGYTVEDNNSTNGLLVNGVRYTAKPIADNDVITIGEFDLVFRRWSTAPTQKNGAADDQPLPNGGRRFEVCTVPKSRSNTVFKLRVIKGKFRGRTFDLNQGKTTLGRAPECDIRLGRFFGPAKHAVIQQRGAHYILEHLDGPAIHVNGQPVTRHVLEIGDQIQFGSNLIAIFES